MATFLNKCLAGEDNVLGFIITDLRGALTLPLCKLINLAIKSFTFLDKWKRARVVPIFKKGDKCQIENYRPTSILNNCAKVFEQVLYDTVYANIKSFISQFQAGSIVPNLACLLNFLTHHVTIYCNINKALLVVLLDST